MLEIAWNVKKTGNFEKKNFLNFIFFNIKKIHKKFKQHSINIKNYTAHPHDLVHVPAKFRENTSMYFWVTVRKLNMTDGRTDRRTDGRGALQYLPSRASGAAPGPPAPREITSSFIFKTKETQILYKTCNNKQQCNLINNRCIPNMYNYMYNLFHNKTRELQIQQ